MKRTMIRKEKPSKTRNLTDSMQFKENIVNIGNDIKLNITALPPQTLR